MPEKKTSKIIAPKAAKKTEPKPDLKAQKLYDYIIPTLNGLAAKGGNWRTIRDEFKRIYLEG